MERIRRRLKAAHDGDRQMVSILAAVLTDGIDAVEAGIAHGQSLPRCTLVFAETPLRWRWNLLRPC